MAASAGEGPRPGPVRRALFVDRDGTINPDLKYLKEADRVELNHGVAEGLSLARAHGFRILCVTNQSGVERGFYTREEVEEIHRRLNERLAARHAPPIDAFYYCPHAPESDCDCRKPRTGLFERARAEWNIDLASSAVIGDRALDVEAGRALGLLTAVVLPKGHERRVREELREHGAEADIESLSFESAVCRILARG